MSGKQPASSVLPAPGISQAQSSLQPRFFDSATFSLSAIPDDSSTWNDNSKQITEEPRVKNPQVESTDAASGHDLTPPHGLDEIIATFGNGYDTAGGSVESLKRQRSRGSVRILSALVSS